ncbi:MAG: methylated-DNA--[protein]-cysteine S-methyltransferase [Candidatus Eremiobacterota bacterium]
MNKIFYTNFDSKIGKIFIASSDRGLSRISLSEGGEGEEDFFAWIKKYYPSYEIVENYEQNDMVVKQLLAYFDKKLKDFTIGLDMKGTDFQLSVWKNLREIPYGEIRTYKDIAEKIGNPKSSRAVGGANRANPFPVVIPCHRVIGTDGRLTGYCGKTGLGIKEFLLKLEGYKGKILYY